MYVSATEVDISDSEYEKEIILKKRPLKIAVWRYLNPPVLWMTACASTHSVKVFHLNESRCEKLTPANEILFLGLRPLTFTIGCGKKKTMFLPAVSRLN